MAIHQQENGIFESLIDSLISPFHDNVLDDFRMVIDESDLWEYRISILILINGIVSGPSDPFERRKIRQKIESQGLLGTFEVFLLS